MLANWTLHRAGFEVPEGRVSFGTTPSIVGSIDFAGVAAVGIERMSPCV